MVGALLREEISEIIESISKGLQSIGVQAETLTTSHVSPEKATLGGLYSMYQGVIMEGSLRVSGRVIEQVELWSYSMGVERTYQMFRGVRMVDVHFLFPRNTEGSKRDFYLEFKKVRKGFLRRMAEYMWEGGELAKSLNEDNNLNKWLVEHDAHVRASTESPVHKYARIIVEMPEDTWNDPSIIVPRIVDWFKPCEIIARHVSEFSSKTRVKDVSLAAEPSQTVSRELSAIEKEAKEIIPIKNYRPPLTLSLRVKELPKPQQDEMKELGKKYRCDVLKFLTIALSYAENERDLLEISRLVEEKLREKRVDLLIDGFKTLENLGLVKLTRRENL